MPYGIMFALGGAALAAALAGVGSILGVRTAAQASAGIVSEDPDKFGKVLLLTALPGSQGIYGFLTANKQPPHQVTHRQIQFRSLTMINESAIGSDNVVLHGQTTQLS